MIPAEINTGYKVTISAHRIYPRPSLALSQLALCAPDSLRVGLNLQRPVKACAQGLPTVGPCLRGVIQISRCNGRPPGRNAPAVRYNIFTSAGFEYTPPSILYYHIILFYYLILVSYLTIDNYTRLKTELMNKL